MMKTELQSGCEWTEDRIIDGMRRKYKTKVNYVREYKEVL
jgi:hypothetical protein